MKEIYLDHAATTKQDIVVSDKMIDTINHYGNPSSIYKIGMEAKDQINHARELIAENINASPEEIFFTSGGSESNNWAIKGVVMNNFHNDNHIITSCIEHPSIINTCKYLEGKLCGVTYLPVNKEGIVDISNLEEEIRYNTRLISVMMVNNELGTIQPIKEIAKIAKKNDVYFHTDAVQAAGNMKIDVEELGVDMLSMSAHKFNGPKGVGVLYIKKGTQIDNLIHGGGQEFGNRAGTENTPAIVGMATALEFASKHRNINNEQCACLRDMFIHRLKEAIPEVKINGSMKYRTSNNASVTFPYIEAESLLLMLNQEGIYCSAGSACSAGKNDASYVLKAIGLTDEEARRTLRFTFGEDNNSGDVMYTVEMLKCIIDRFR